MRSLVSTLAMACLVLQGCRNPKTSDDDPKVSSNVWQISHPMGQKDFCQAEITLPEYKITVMLLNDNSTSVFVKDKQKEWDIDSALFAYIGHTSTPASFKVARPDGPYIRLKIIL